MAIWGDACIVLAVLCAVGCLAHFLARFALRPPLPPDPVCSSYARRTERGALSLHNVGRRAENKWVGGEGGQDGERRQGLQTL